MEPQVYSAFSYKYHMIKDKPMLFDRELVNSGRMAATMVRNIIFAVGQSDRENMVVMMLDAKNKVVGFNLVSVGTICRAAVDPRDILKTVITTPCCMGIVIGHNHPSGDCTPSREDVVFTKILVNCAFLLSIVFHDHVIVDMNSDAFYSFEEDGKMEEMLEAAKMIDLLSLKKAGDA